MFVKICCESIIPLIIFNLFVIIEVYAFVSTKSQALVFYLYLGIFNFCCILLTIKKRQRDQSPVEKTLLEDYIDYESVDGVQEICTICLEDMNDNNIVVLVKNDEQVCEHKFHKECIEKWVLKLKQSKNNITCPNCRANYV